MASSQDMKSALSSTYLYSAGSMILLLETAVFGGLVEGLTSWFMEALRTVVVTLSEFAGWFIVTTVKEMLFFPPPGEFNALTNLYWGVSFPIFFGLLSLSITVFFLMMQLSPGNEETQLDSFMQRVFIAVVLVIIVGAGGLIPTGAGIPQQGIFGYGVEFINIIGKSLFPPSLQLQVDLDTYRGMATTSLGGFAVLLFPIVASPKIFLTYATFLTAIGLRATIIYTTYALFPILIAMWVGEVGPLKYGKMVSSIMFKATILLLLMGVLLSGILGVGGAIATDTGGMTNPDAENISVVNNNKATEGTRLEGGVLHQDSVQFTATDRGATTEAWVSVFAFFGSIWLCVTLVGMTLGGFVSTGFSKNLAKADKGIKGAKKVKEGLSDSERLSGDHDSLGDRVSDKIDGVTEGAKEKAGWTDENAESETFAGEPENRSITDDVRDVVGNMKSATDDVKDKAGEAKDKAGEAKDKVGEHAGNVKDYAEDSYSFAKSEAQDVKENFEEAGENFSDKASGLGDKFDGKMSELGEGAGDIAASFGGPIAGAGAQGAVTAVGKAGNMAATAGGKVGEYGMKGIAKSGSAASTLARKSPNLAKRGGKAYWSVFKQPDIESSLGEVGRIAKESPIGKPEKPKDMDADAETDAGESEDEDEDEDEDDETRRHRAPRDVGDYDVNKLYQGMYDRDNSRRHRDDEHVGNYDTGNFYDSVDPDMVDGGDREPGEPGEEYEPSKEYGKPGEASEPDEEHQNRTEEDTNSTSDYETGSHYQSLEPDWVDSYNGMETRGHSEPSDEDMNATSSDKRRPEDYRSD